MIEFFSPAATVLTLSFVIGHHNSLTGGDAAIEPSLNNTVNILRWTNAFQKRSTGSFIRSPSCGRTKVRISPLSRGKTIFKDDGDDLYDEINDDEHLDKIFGGSYAVYGEVPWQVSIRYSDYLVCSGAIISEFWVVSAAHCFRNARLSNFDISVGDHLMWHRDSHGARFEVNEVVIPTEFGKIKFDHDIALLKIKATSDGRGIRFNDYVQPICLAYPSDVPPVGLEVTVTGWGRTGTGGVLSPILKKVKLVVTPKADCERVFGKLRIICVVDKNRESELCVGDSGGPAYFIHRGQAVLLGVVAAGSDCGAPIFLSGLTSVPALRDWIEDTIYLSTRSEFVPPQNSG